MSAPPKVYRGDEVLCDFGGKRISGYGEDEFVSIADSTPRASKLVGTDGEVIVSQHADKSGEVTVTLLITSDANDIFQDALDRNQRGPGMEFKPLLVRDLNGRAKHSFPHCWVMEAPTVVYGRSGRAHAWKLGYASRVPGGIRGSAPAT
jgi:hypothetical protein